MIRNVTKTILSASAVVLISAANLSAQEGDAPNPDLGFQPNAAVTAQLDDASLKQKASFILGYKMTSEWMNGLKGQGVDLDADACMDGIRKAVAGEEFGMSNEEVQSAMMAFEKIVEKQSIEKMKVAADANKAEGDAYLAANAKKEGVKTLDNGVQYEVMTEGTGEIPTADDTVSVHYHGTLPNGDVFDSSVNHPSGRPPEPAEFNVGGVVPGFSSALQAMKVGSKWKVTIPSDLAYGIRGPGPIGPNRTLVFEIELLKIVK